MSVTLLMSSLLALLLDVSVMMQAEIEFTPLLDLHTRLNISAWLTLQLT